MSAAALRPARLAPLDGLRGWAALSVVVFHLTWETFGKLFPAFRLFPSALFGHGSLAVALFLMVSGYVLTIGGWRNPDKSGVRRSMLKRYVRLTIPILASVLLFWAVLALGWAPSREAGAIVQRPDWLGSFGHLKPNLPSALIFGGFGVYLRTGAQSYGPFLWTMTIEFWGSFVVLAACWLEPRGRWAYVPLAVIGVALLFAPTDSSRLAGCYAAGALVALAVKDGLLPSGPPSRRENGLATLVAAAALVAAALAQMASAPGYVTVPIAVVAFVAILRSSTVSRALSSPLSQWLGRLSFPLYLIQILIIVTITSWLIIWTSERNTLDLLSAGAIALVSLAACLLVAQLFMPIERLALAAARQVGKLIKSRSGAQT